MKAAVVRLLIISFTCLFLVFMALFWLRFLGLQQEYAPIQHPLMQSLPWRILKNPEKHLNPEEFTHWVETHVRPQDRWPWLDLRRSQDGQWIVAPLEWVEKDGFKQALHTLNYSDIQSAWPNQQVLEFGEALALTEGLPLFLNVIEKDVYWHTEFGKLIPENRKEQIIVRSPIKSFGKKLREAHPEFLFASEPSTLSQFLMFEGLYLESVAGFWPDILLVPPIYRGRKIFDSRIISEMKRRHLPVVVDFSKLDELDALPEGLPIQGLATHSPEALKEASAKLLDLTSTKQ